MGCYQPLIPYISIGNCNSELIFGMRASLRILFKYMISYPIISIKFFCDVITSDRYSIKAGTHEGACSRSTLLQHTPGAKLPRLHQRFLVKKYVAQQNFCSRVLLPHIKLVWYEGASSMGKSVARFCFRSKLPRVYWNLLCESLFQEQAPSCVLKFALRERVPGASSLVCTGWGTYPGACFGSKLLRVYWLEYLPGSVFQEQAPSCVPAFKSRWVPVAFLCLTKCLFSQLQASSLLHLPDTVQWLLQCRSRTP